MTLLGRLTTLGLAKETTQGTYVAPTVFIPHTKIDAEDMYAEIKDESVRGDDTILHGMYQGPANSSVHFTCEAYPDVLGHLLRAVIGPDTVSAGTSTTLSSSSLAGATTLSTVASVAAGKIIKIDTGSLTEYAKVSSVSGSGPYSLTLSSADWTPGYTGLKYAHSSAVAVVSQTLHTFAQNPAQSRPSYSLTRYNGLEAQGFPGCVCSELQLKIDPKGAVTADAKYTGWPSAIQSTPTASYSTLAPLLGWQWTMTNAGSSSTRGLTYDFHVKRQVDAIHASNGLQTPREVFMGALDVEAKYKAIYESDADLNLYLDYIQTPTVATLTQPVGSGGAILALTMSASGYHKGKVDTDQHYVQFDGDISGIYNTTDGGALAATLYNFTTTQY